jgi:protein arginine N-methyltransferase 1
MQKNQQNHMNYYHEQVWAPFSANTLGWDMDFHHLMLNDELRMRQYETAIKQAVQPGMVVLDLGTGTGILAKWALQAGAARVYGIEVNPLTLATATDNLRQAGFADRFHPLVGFSYQVTLPEQVDLIISEIIGNLADNEDCITILSDAKKRFLKPDGLMLPAALVSRFVPVMAAHAHQQVSRRQCASLSEHYDLDELLSHLRLSSPFDLYYDVILPRTSYLAEPQNGMNFDFLQIDDAPDYAFDLTFSATRDGQLCGFKGSFAAQLSAQVKLDISGDDIAGKTTSDSWKHAFLPIAEPISIRRGDQIVLHYRRLPNIASRLSCRYAWDGVVLREGQVTGQFSQSMRETWEDALPQKKQPSQFFQTSNSQTN